MNRKLTIAIVAVIATILPAVAVADVMITGTFDIEGGTNGNVFYFQPGSNYQTAHNDGLITWIEPTTPSTQGTIDLQGIDNQSVQMVNVLDLNFSTSPTAIPPPFVLYLNITNSDFPAGVAMVLSTSPLTLPELAATSVQNYVGTPIPVNCALSTTQVGVYLSQNPSLILTNFNGGTTIYIGFIVPSGGLAGYSATIVGTFITT